MAKAQFDLSSLMDTVSKLDTTAAAPQLLMIPLEDILDNRDNFYKLSDLDPLADSIAMEGLQQPLVVTPYGDKVGKYLLISGHRRRAAIKKLVEDKTNPREDLRLVPCLVRTYASPAMAELQLILANSTTRVLTNAEISKQAEKLELLLYQLKEEGYQFPGRMRDQVAAACKVSAPKLARLKVIREKLYCDFMYLFEKNKLPEQTAYALARLPAEFQARISKVMVGDAPRGCAVERVLERYEKGWRWEPDQKCPDGKACKRGDTFLRHDLEHSFDMCGGNKCCLTCQRALDNYFVCDRMCSKAQAQRKAKKVKKDEAAKKAQEKQVKEYQAATQKNAQRLLPAIDAAGLPDKSKIQWRNYGYSVAISVDTIRKLARGVFDDPRCPWHGEYLAPAQLDNPASLAKLLGCSTDYLLGVTDQLLPAAPEEPESPPEPDPVPVQPEDDGPEDAPWPHWQTGRPTQTGEYLVRFLANGFNMRGVLDYSRFSDRWTWPNTGKPLDCEVVGWYPIPQMFEEDDDAEN